MSLYQGVEGGLIEGVSECDAADMEDRIYAWVHVLSIHRERDRSAAEERGDMAEMSKLAVSDEFWRSWVSEVLERMHQWTQNDPIREGKAQEVAHTRDDGSKSLGYRWKRWILSELEYESMCAALANFHTATVVALRSSIESRQIYVINYLKKFEEFDKIGDFRKQTSNVRGSSSDDRFLSLLADLEKLQHERQATLTATYSRLQSCEGRTTTAASSSDARDNGVGFQAGGGGLEIDRDAAVVRAQDVESFVSVTGATNLVAYNYLVEAELSERVRVRSSLSESSEIDSESCLSHAIARFFDGQGTVGVRHQVLDY